MSDQSDKPAAPDSPESPESPASVKPDAKTFANMHYPGMRSNPNEGREAMHADARWRFTPQIDCIGEDAQKRILQASVFVGAASPLGVAIAQKLMLVGFGRVGVYGEQALTGASHLALGDSPKAMTLPALGAWAKKQAPWVEFETFREVSVDRSLSDIARGFGLLVSAGGAQTTGQVLAVARETGLAVLAAHVSGKQSWCASVGGNSICEDCLAVPVLGTEGQTAEVSAGIYYPLLDFAATWVAALAMDYVMGQPIQGAFVESVDAARSPWLREMRETPSKPNCPKCSPAK